MLLKYAIGFPRISAHFRDYIVEEKKMLIAPIILQTKVLFFQMGYSQKP